MLSQTTRKKSASLRSCSELSATYFSRSLGRSRRLIMKRATCSSIESTCAGSSPRNPSSSRSASVKAVPLLNSGSRNSAMPRGESEGCEVSWARAGAFMVFPHRQFVIFWNPPVKRMAFEQGRRSRSDLVPPRHCTAATFGTRAVQGQCAARSCGLRRRWAVSHRTDKAVSSAIVEIKARSSSEEGRFPSHHSRFRA